ncbi:MAG: RAMP superfamily CRISPR-associated protein [Chloroflexi bacterium]|nr:RAMP superfamily CRISPR-associated protein [Chloroflexota bacterium]
MTSSSPQIPRLPLPASAVTERIVAAGILGLISAAHLGGGEGDSTDAQLLRDGNGALFIPGSSLAGAMRSFLRERQTSPVVLAWLFGGAERDSGDTGALSTLIVDDAYLVEGKPATTTVRDGVRIALGTGTAADSGKFDYEVIEPPTAFQLRFELVLRRQHEERATELARLFNALLDAFSGGDLPLGAHTRRGLGRCRVEDWRVAERRFAELSDVVAWLQQTSPAEQAPVRARGARPGDAIPPPQLPLLEITARLSLRTAVLVRSTPPWSPESPDAVQLRSGDKPVVPGTSLAGVLRHRAERIVRTLGASEERGCSLIEGMFGPGFRGSVPPREHRRSRLLVADAPIDGEQEKGKQPPEEVQTRIAIDRFTGGVLGTALLQEQPAWPDGNGGRALELLLQLVAPVDALGALDQPRLEAECGLLLLLLRDLCTGDLAVGGTQAVGRGVLRGEEGTVLWRAGPPRAESWRWRRSGEAIEITQGDPAQWNEWARALVTWLTAGEGK